MNFEKVQWCQTVTFKRIQCHPGLTYIFYLMMKLPILPCAEKTRKLVLSTAQKLDIRALCAYGFIHG